MKMLTVTLSHTIQLKSGRVKAGDEVIFSEIDLNNLIQDIPNLKYEIVKVDESKNETDHTTQDYVAGLSLEQVKEELTNKEIIFDSITNESKLRKKLVKVLSEKGL